MDLRAEMLLERQCYEDAVAWCRQALDRGHASPRVRLVLGRALIALHREDEAETEIRAHLQLNPRDPEAYRMLGEIAFREDRYPESRWLLQEALRLAPADDSTRMLLDVVRSVGEGADPEPALSEQATVVVAPPHPPPAASADSRSAAARAVITTLDLPHPASTDERRTVLPAPPPPAGRALWTTGGVVVAVAVVLAVWILSPSAGTGATKPAAAASMAAAPAARPSIERPAPKPSLPRELSGDAWIHPLDGPIRRMPMRDGRGVDLGETWGEPVLAVHDGVIDRVQRGPTPDHGGMYVRIAHRGGRIFTQYFHLAGIPRRIVPGVSVRMGDVIGMVGDTGVKQSGPHLHFTISVRPTKNGQERYIDPEPLIALWPLRMPAGGGQGRIVDIEAAPGLPRGASAARR